MEEESTTNATVETGGQVIQGVAVDDQGQAVPQPEETETAEAVSTETTESPESHTQATTEQSEVATVEPSEDEQLEKFASAKGLTLDSDNAKKAAKMAMNAEKLMHQKTQKASELEKTMSGMSDESAEQTALATGQNPEVLKRLQRMEVKESIRDFWDSNPDARQYESEMATIAVESGLYGSPEAILKASYAIARANDVAGIKSQAKKETLQKLAHNQQAAVPRGNAVNATATAAAITPQNVDRLVGQNNLEWYKAHRDEINKAMAG